MKWKRATIRGRGGSRFFPSRVLLADYFPIEPGFSITIHKAQVCVCILYIIKIQICPIWLQWIHYQFFYKGRTIQKVILSISEHPFQFTRLKWEGLYVALSRVWKKDDIRLLLRFNDRSTMDYIINLEKNKFIKCFFDGYKTDQTILRRVDSSINCDEYQCQPMKWSGKKASTSAGFIGGEAEC